MSKSVIPVSSRHPQLFQHMGEKGSPSSPGPFKVKQWFTVSLKASQASQSLLLFSSQSCPARWDPMDCSMPAFPVLHYLSEFAQTHVHWVGDAIKPSPSLSELLLKTRSKVRAIPKMRKISDSAWHRLPQVGDSNLLLRVGRRESVLCPTPDPGFPRAWPCCPPSTWSCTSLIPARREDILDWTHVFLPFSCPSPILSLHSVRISLFLD